jgi:hypothetical protein
MARPDDEVVGAKVTNTSDISLPSRKDGDGLLGELNRRPVSHDETIAREAFEHLVATIRFDPREHGVEFTFGA